jgi:DNA-binding NtrC family response regulator
MNSPMARRTADETTALSVKQTSAAGDAPLTLHVVREGRVDTFPLTPGKRTIIGRSADADVRIDEPAVSRTHAAIDVGATIVLSDLGSSNGIRVGGASLASGRSLPITPGTTFEIGSAILVLRGTHRAAPPRRVWTHGFFDGRLADECVRAETLGKTFSLLRLSVAVEDEAKALDVVSSELPPTAVLALQAPGEIEALVSSEAGIDAEGAARRIATHLGDAARAFAVVDWPRDGRSAEELLAHANERLAQAKAKPTEPAPTSVRAFGAHLAEIERLVARIARGNVNVLILGETGVGKELVGEMVHLASPRRAKPYLKLNCGSFTETLLASELFGHERGAFTGADRAKAGLFESADGGTVFLDEIGELPLSLQPNLLRVLENGEVMRVGSLRPHRVDVRFVAATHRDLESEAHAGRFRADLYFRLAGFTITVKPLRDRPAEIAELARGFLNELARASNVALPPVDPAVFEILQRYSWPGNARELRNVVQRALLLAGDGPIRTEHLPLDKLTARGGAPSGGASPSFRDERDALERRRIMEELERHAGNQTQAAKALGISRGTLITRMEAYGLARPRKR